MSEGGVISHALRRDVSVEKFGKGGDAGDQDLRLVHHHDSAEDGCSATHKGDGHSILAGAFPVVEEVNKSRLPPLPLPELQDTAARFLDAVRILVSPEEYQRAEEAVQKLLEDEGPPLQRRLAEGPTPPYCSYVESYWVDAYLRSRAPLPLNSNPFFVLEKDPSPTGNGLIGRATSLILSMLTFHHAVRTGTLKSDQFRKTPLCMHQYSWIFNSCRIPGIGRDWSFVDSDSRHIAVLDRGFVYWFNCLSSDGSRCIKPETLRRNLTQIHVHAKRAPHKEALRQAVGVLTSEQRDRWARARTAIARADPAGDTSLRLIESAIFVVCLDDTRPTSLAEESANTLHGTHEVDSTGVQCGTCLNRWYDKSIQLIVGENGFAGVNFEHSRLDGHSVLRLASDVISDLLVRVAQQIQGDIPSVMEPLKTGDIDLDSTPVHIRWSLTSSIRRAIRRAEARIGDAINQTEVETLEFTDFGKLGIVEQKMSPDGFVQLGFQLAYFRLYGELRCTYETAMTKAFLHGRTEPVRAATEEMLAFVEAFDDDLVDPAHHISREEKRRVLRQALQNQTTSTRNASSGQGFDRHMFALQNAAKEAHLPVPEIFSSTAWETVNENILSTSNCGNPSLRMFGFGPVCEEGMGIGYLIKDASMVFCFSSKTRQTHRYMHILRAAFRDMMAVIQDDTAAVPRERPTLPPGSFRLDDDSDSDFDCAERNEKRMRHE